MTRFNSNVLAACLLLVLSVTAACTRLPDSSVAAATALPAQTGALATPVAADAALPLVIVHNDPNCGCCGAWISHLRAAGFPVEVRDSGDLIPIKEQFGVPADKRSCHTAEVGGYFVEGHVPAADIKRLLAEKPDAKGLAVPGMPAGSPGMASPDGTVQPYTVELIARDGSSSVFAQH
jgi:hypothetical protein